MTRRLPSLNAAMVTQSLPFAPRPPQQPPAELGYAKDMEATTVPTPWSRAKETSVYITQRRWRACDVYIETPQPTGVPADYTLSVFVYAVAQGSRTLVASGRMHFDSTQVAFTVRLREWIVAARSSAERYEVTTRVDQATGSADVPGQILVTVVATDEMTTPPPNQGSLRLGIRNANNYKFNGVGLVAPPRLEVMGVTGINEAAAARYLMLFDTNVFSAIDLAGTKPMEVWSLGAAVGVGVVDSSIRYRCASAPVLAVSSNPVVYADPGDGLVGIVVR